MAQDLPVELHIGVAVLAGIVLGSPAQALADVRILQSNAPGIAKHTVLSDSDILDIPAGKKIKVLLPSNVTKVIAGPYVGTAKDYAPSILPSGAEKPSVQFDAGTTLNAPNPALRHKK